MTKNKLTITGIQADLSWHNPEKNRMYFAQQIKNLSANTDLIVLPEMFTTGFTMYPEQICKNEQQRTVNWLVELSATHNTAICGSIITSKDDAFFNTFYFVQPCGTINTYIKRHSFTLAGEDKAYTAGNTKTIITYKGWRICPLICYDLRFPVWARNTENYDVLLYVANWPETELKPGKRY
jgi:Predicted amidohydrolase